MSCWLKTDQTIIFPMSSSRAKINQYNNQSGTDCVTSSIIFCKQIVPQRLLVLDNAQRGGTCFNHAERGGAGTDDLHVLSVIMETTTFSQ